MEVSVLREVKRAAVTKIFFSWKQHSSHFSLYTYKPEQTYTDKKAKRRIVW